MIDYKSTELVTTDGKHYTTTVRSAKACAVYEINALWTFIDQYDWLWGICFIFIGVFKTFMGSILFKIAIFLVAAQLAMFGILLLFYGTFLGVTTEDWVGWTILITSILVGFVVGLFTMKMEREGSALVAAWGGFILGLTLNEAVLYLSGSEVLFWGVCITLALINSILYFYYT